MYNTLHQITYRGCDKHDIMEFFLVVIALLIVREEGDKVLQRVLDSAPELSGHQTTHAVEEVLGQNGSLVRVGRYEARPAVLVGSKQVTTVRYPSGTWYKSYCHP